MIARLAPIALAPAPAAAIAELGGRGMGGVEAEKAHRGAETGTSGGDGRGP